MTTDQRASVWLAILYWYTIIGAGTVGLLVAFAPGVFVSLFGLPQQDPYVLGIAGGLFLGSGVAAAVGVRAPRRYAPIFLVQLGYKTVWLLAVFVPRLVRGQEVPFYAWLIAAIFASYVVLDVVVISAEGLLGARNT